jgi:hypothetical protein
LLPADCNSAVVGTQSECRLRKDYERQLATTDVFNILSEVESPLPGEQGGRRTAMAEQEQVRSAKTLRGPWASSEMRGRLRH